MEWAKRSVGGSQPLAGLLEEALDDSFCVLLLFSAQMAMVYLVAAWAKRKRSKLANPHF